MSDPSASAERGRTAASGRAPIVRLEGLEIGYRPNRGAPVVVASGLDAALERGELVCVLGPNGSGKSTLLRTIVGFQAPLRGSVTLAGRAVASLSPRERAMLVSVVLTERVDAGLLSARELVALGRYPYTRWNGGSGERDEEVVEWAIAAVNAVEVAHRPLASLSDGERQKVMIARALAQEPRLIVLDEPTAYLDFPRKVETFELLGRLAHDEGRTVLLSTHDLELALANADRLWLITPERRLAAGAPEDLVLSGSFARSFSSDALRFDLSSGGFRAVRRLDRRIGIRGSEPVRSWTERALERAGLAADPECRDPFVSVEESAGGCSWTLRFGAEVRSCASLYDLVALARALAADRGPT